MPDTFTTALDLAGWDDASIWGYDAQLGTDFAQLWRNRDDSYEAPTVWISGALDPVPTTSALVDAIADATGIDRTTVVDAMPLPGPAAPAGPSAADRAELDDLWHATQLLHDRADGR